MSTSFGKQKNNLKTFDNPLDKADLKLYNRVYDFAVIA